MRHFAFVIPILCLWLAACKGTTVAPYDPPFYLKGVVYDAGTGQPLSGVTLSWKGPDLADTLIFAGDTLSTKWSQVLHRTVQTAADGSFVFEFVPCARDTSRYPFLFAVKPGYKLWRWILSPVSASPVDKSSDFTRIPLTSM